jgi:hypothetical protein
MPTDALFDLAVNRAASYLARLGLLGTDADDQRLYAALELWYLKTRFAYRVPLETVIAVLLSYPASSNVPQHWQGGESGKWYPGSPPTP